LSKPVFGKAALITEMPEGRKALIEIKAVSE